MSKSVIHIGAATKRSGKSIRDSFSVVSFLSLRAREWRVAVVALSARIAVADNAVDVGSNFDEMSKTDPQCQAR